MLCPEASTRKIFGGRKRFGKRRSGEGRRRIITTIGMVGMTRRRIRKSGKYNAFYGRYHGGYNTILEEDISPHLNTLV